MCESAPYLSIFWISFYIFSASESMYCTTHPIISFVWDHRLVWSYFYNFSILKWKILINSGVHYPKRMPMFISWVFCLIFSYFILSTSIFFADFCHQCNSYVNSCANFFLQKKNRSCVATWRIQVLKRIFLDYSKHQRIDTFC